MRKFPVVIASTVAAPALVLTLAVTAAPAPALATDAEVAAAWDQAASSMFDSNDYHSYTSASSAEAVPLSDANVSATGPVSYFNLYDLGFVTPAKTQRPWNDCWAFGSIAAAETSLLSKGVSQAAADLSERALVNTVYTGTGTAQSVVPNTAAGLAQVGENANASYANTSSGFDVGGRVTYALTLFSAGLALVPESQAPYQNNVGVYECEVTLASTGEKQTKYLTQEQVDAYKEANPNDTVTVKGWAGPYEYVDEKSGWEKKGYYDWGSDDSIWTRSSYTLSDANVLPEPRIIEWKGETGTFKGTDSRAVAAIKSELYAGHGVSAGYHLDETNDVDHPVTKYFNRNAWAHYTWEKNAPNHRVCIVGWDDNYDASNFQNSAGITPPGNGAWIVKQSSGAESDGQEFPDRNAWGIVNEDGEHTGYFYLSYYDQSLSGLVTFDFDLDATDTADTYADQYDFLTERDAISVSSDVPLSSANIFEAQGDMTLEAVMSATYRENTTVTYQVYLLDDEATTPTEAGHSTLASTTQATYAYGGYHRTALAAADQVRMRAGQRYAVVTTQKCNDDGKWYQGVACNTDSFAGKLNAGESFTGTTAGTVSGVSEATDWSDWLKVKEGINGQITWSVDNAPVKAFSRKSTWASTQELAALRQAVADAKAKLAAAQVSADGTDVEAAKTWVTQEEYDQATADIAAAEALLAQAGDDLSGMAETGDVNEAAAALANFNPQPGTKQDKDDKGDKDDDKKGDKGDKGDDKKDDKGGEKTDGSSTSDNADTSAQTTKLAAKKPKAGTPSTGDATAAAPAALLAASGMGALLGAARRHGHGRNRQD